MTDLRPLRVDVQVPRAAGEGRQATDVAVGVLMRPDGRFLMSTRPAGKAYAGFWEFPGGKVEHEENVLQALARELDEELGLRPLESFAWRVQLVDYPHALVRLHFVKVLAWAGVPTPRESQLITWESLPVQVQPILPGALPVLEWLAAERDPGTAPRVD